MPGIVGVVSRRPPDECQRLVATMVASMMHEPFYESGTCSAPDLGVYAGWTAHRTSAAARQCASEAHQDISVVLAGECVGDEHPCLASLYSQHGEAFVRRLNGQFSGLVVDRVRRHAVLFNDRFGLERLYVYEAPDAVFFASEAKALLRALPEARSFDDEGTAQFLAFGCTRDWRTLFRGVSLLEGGTVWSFANGTSQRSRYFVPSEWESQPVLSEDAFEEEFVRTFRKVLPRYLGSGDGIGLSLTGGLDTRMIMACLPHLPAAPVTYTFSGRHERTLDERIAARVAAARGLEHRILRLDDGFLANYRQLVDRTVYVTDGCFGATGTHEIYLNAKARRLAPVRVTGNFGSEVLRSMSTFKPIGLSRELIHADFAPSVSSAEHGANERNAHPVTFATFQEIPWSLFGSLAAGRSQTTFRTPYLDNDLVALAYRAPLASRQSPNVALRLIQENSPALASIATDRGLTSRPSGVAHAMRRAVAEVSFKLDYMHKEGPPHWLKGADPVLGALASAGILGWHKYLPYRHWFRHELNRHVTEVLTDPSMSRLNMLNGGVLPTIARDHVAGRRNYVREIGTALTLESIDRQFLRGWTS